MNKIFFVVLLVVSLGLAACQPTAPAASQPAGSAATQPTDPAAVMDAYTAAINAHDVELALSYVADDAAYERAAGNFEGKEAVRTFVEGIIARNVQVELIGERTVEGERVIWQSRIMIDDPQDSSVRLEIVNNSESTIRDGKIVFHTATPVQQ